MRRITFSCLLLLSVMLRMTFAQEARHLLRVTPSGKGKINTMIDNIGYWSDMVRIGYVLPDSSVLMPPPRYSGSMIDQQGIPPQNSPDVPVTGETDVTQTENSVFIDPNDEYLLLNSNNSSDWISGYAQTPFGADALYSTDQGQSWSGNTQGVNGFNSGDPATAIGRNGWWYAGRITNDNGQAVSYSKDNGLTWTRVKVGQGPTSGFGLLDKNHLWIDNSVTSPYSGNLYAAWTNFITGTSDTNQIQVTRSANGGLNWSSPVKISAGVNALKLNHGVNIHTGPAGEVYAVWSIYDTWPSDEKAIGFARSLNGGASWQTSTRIISNLKGIRNSLTSKNMRVHAFPSMAVDISEGPHRGTIYIVFPNVGYPGINTGTDIDIYLIRSTDGGSTWSTPLRVNQDPPGLGKQHFFPWITCDPVTGGLCVIYYDDRNLPATDAATYVSWSYDGGMSWSDLQISDYSFTPAPVPGLAFSYFGDYIGIQSRNMKVYPVWTDNHENDRPMTWTSPFDLGANPGQPWVNYYSHSFSPVGGTGSVNLNYGDSLHLNLGLKNIGDRIARHVTATVTSPSPYITVTDSIQYYDSIVSGQVKTIQDGFAFKVSDTIPDNIPVRFNISVVSTDSSAFHWDSHFSAESHAPDLKILSMVILDTINGNRNGRLEPGEIAELQINLVNGGDFGTGAADGKLTSSLSYLSLFSDSIHWDNISPGQQITAKFIASTDPLTPAGTGVLLHFNLRAGDYIRNKIFRQVIGLVVEDWETNTFTKFPWQSAGSKPWTLTTQLPWEGNYCLKSGQITDYQNSQFFINYSVAADDSIFFYVKTSSEQDYDYLMFSIDAVWQGQWSGETPWTRVAFPVAAGNHVFKWIYLKDLSFANGEDRAWVDFIALPPPVLPAVAAGPDDTICAGETALLTAQVTGADSTKWTTTGDGVFGNDTLLNTTYIPGNSDISTGIVTLRITGYGKYGNTAGEKKILIRNLPVIHIQSVPGDTVCAGQTIKLVSDTVNILSYYWIPGSFTTPDAIYDTLVSGGAGTHRVKLTLRNTAGCMNTDSVFIHFKNCAGIELPDKGTPEIVPNPSNGIFNISGIIFKPGTLEVTVTDIPGAIKYQESRTVKKLSDNESFNLNSLRNGLYLLSLKQHTGTSVFKLIIRK